MLPDNYRNGAIVTLTIFALFSLVAYFLLFQTPETDGLGIRITQNGFIYPTFALQGLWRLCMGGMFAIFALLSGFVGIYLMSWYIDYKKRS